MNKITQPEEEYLLYIDLSTIKDVAGLEKALQARFGNEMDLEKMKRLAKAIMGASKRSPAERPQS